MSSTTAPLLLLLPLALGAGARDADEPTATEILDRVYANYGSAERLAAVKNRVMEGEATFGGVEGGTFKETLAGLCEARIETVLPGFGSIQEGATCGVVWELNPMTGGGRVRTGAAAMASLRHYGALQHTPWRELYAEAELLGGADLDGRPVFKLELKPRALLLQASEDEKSGVVTVDEEPPEGVEQPDPETWWVDQETFLLSRQDIVTKDPVGEQRYQVSYSDYRPVDGILYAHERSVKMGELLFVARYTSIRHDVELPDNAFDVPSEVREAIGAALTDEPPAAGIRIEEVEEVHAAVIRVQCPIAEISQQMSISLPEVMIHLTSVGAQVTGAPFTRYYNAPEGEDGLLDFESGMPTAEPIEPHGRIVPITIPAGRAVSAWHVGPYDQLSVTHAEVQAWMAEQGLEPAGPLQEVYWTDPGMEPDPKKWRTQLLVPIGE
jgi:effector-binding domain-containing protein